MRSLFAVFILFWAFGAQAESHTAVYVEFRASESAEAPVTERWKLYGSSHALVIGIDNYANGWPRLSNAIKDARLVAEALEEKGFEVELLIDPTSEQLRPRLRQFFAIKGADPDARLFIWFAGHGHTFRGEGYLVPADAPPPESPLFLLKALHMGDVASMVRIAASKHVLAVFDSCFAGTVFQSQRSRPPAAITGAVKRPVRQFLTSGDADQKVSDDGTFRTLFLRALRGEETADANRDGYLTGSELSFYLEHRLINLTNGTQTPRGGKLRDARFDQGDFVFLLPKAAPKSATVFESSVTEEPGSATFELAFWQAIQHSNNPSDYRAYLETYPQGKFVRLAQVRIETLSATETSTKQVVTLPKAGIPEESSVSHPYDGVWKGTGRIMKNWCRFQAGSSQFDLTITVENGQISGGDPDGLYVAEGRVSAEGRLLNAKLTKKLIMSGSLERGTLNRDNFDCGGSYRLTKVD